MSPVACLAIPSVAAALPPGIAGPLLAQLVRASIEGALFAGAVWLLCRLVPRLPASARSLLWWAACLKLVVGLFWVAPLPLRVLPADLEVAAPLARWAGLATEGLPGVVDPGARLDRSSTETAALRAGSGRTDRAPDASPGLGSPTAPVAKALGSPGDNGPPVRALGPLSGRGPVQGKTDLSASGPGSPQPSQSLASGLFGRVARAAGHLRLGMLLAALWMLGALAGLAALAAQLGRTRQVRRSSAPVAEPLVGALFSGLCRDMGLRRRPELLASEEVGTPQALGLRHPAVILPRADLARLSSQELEMALCHELVHLRRRDLWLGWVPALAERLFFFHPLAALAAREYALAREAACDAEVLRVLGAAPRDYGRLLVRLGVTRRPAPAFALGAAPPVATLKRRLEMLQNSSETPRRRPVWLWLVGLALVAALPSFRLVALTRPAAEPAAAVAESAGAKSTALAGRATATAAAQAKPVNAESVALAIAEPATAGSIANPAVAPKVVVNTASASAIAQAALTTAASALAEADITLAKATPAASTSARAASASPTPPAPPTAPTPPTPPTPAAKAGDAGEHSSWTWSSDDDDSASYVLRLGNSNFMHGSSDDVARAKALGGGDVLWFRRGGKEYAIRDAAVLKAAKELVRPSMELGKRQGELGSRQAALGSEQAKLGSRQAELGSRQAELGSRQAQLAMQQAARGREDGKTDDLEQQQRELGRQQDELGRQQGELGKQQGALGEKQGALGEQQGELGRQQAEASRKAEAGLARLVDDAVKRGLAQEVKR